MNLESLLQNEEVCSCLPKLSAMEDVVLLEWARQANPTDKNPVVVDYYNWQGRHVTNRGSSHTSYWLGCVRTKEPR